MATNQVMDIPPPPPPLEPWKEFLVRMRRHALENTQATPDEFLQQIEGKPDSALLPLHSLRTLLTNNKQTFLPTSLVVGVVARKFHPRFWERGPTSGCSFALWLRDATDLVRVTFWDAAAHMHYEKVEEGRLLSITGFKLKPLYRHEKESQFEVERLSPVEITMSGPSGPVRAIKVSRVLAVDTHKVWNCDVGPDLPNLRSFLRPLLNFEFGPETLKTLADRPISMEFRRSISARIIYKSAIRETNSVYGEVPCVWLALFDGSLEGREMGSGRKEHIWLLLTFNLQPDLLEQLAPNQLIVVTHVVSLYLFHDEWSEFLEWRLICHSTASTQVHIVAEEPDSSVWHYIRSVSEKKDSVVSKYAKGLSRSFGDVPPEISHLSNTETLFKLGRFECEYRHS